jgi:hypothetical protein
MDGDRGGAQVDGAGKGELRVERHLGASLALWRTNFPDPVGRAPDGEPTQIEDGGAVLIAMHQDRAVRALGIARPPHKDGAGGRGGGRGDDGAGAVLPGALPRGDACGNGAVEPAAAHGALTGSRTGDRERAHAPSEAGTDLESADVTGAVLRTCDTARIGEIERQAQGE